MKILIIGANGGIGAELVKKLSEKHRITAFYHSSCQYCSIPSVRLIKGDANNYQHLINASQNQDVIIYCALEIKRRSNKNVVPGEISLRCALENKCKLFVFFSSWAVYSSCINHQYLTEDVPVKTNVLLDRYTKDKIIGENKVQSLCSGSKTHYLILRPSIVIGERLMWFYKAANFLKFFPFMWKNKTINVIHVVDLAEQVSRLIDNSKTYDQIYNMGNEDYNTDTFFTQIGKTSGLNIFGLPQFIQNALSLFLPSSFWFLKKNVQFSNKKINHSADYRPNLNFISFLEGRSLETLKCLNEAEVKRAYHMSSQSCQAIGCGNTRTIYKMDYEGKGIIDLSSFNRVIFLDKEHSTVTAEAGISLIDLCEYLNDHNLTLPTLPEFLGLSLGSCIVTPIHGSSDEYNCLADVVTSMEYYINGEKKHSKKGDKNWNSLFFKPDSNMVITQITIKCVPQQYLTRKARFVNEDNMEEFLENSRDLFGKVIEWYPAAKQLMVWEFEKVTHNQSSWIFYIPRHTKYFFHKIYTWLIPQVYGKGYEVLGPWQRTNFIEKFVLTKIFDVNSTEFSVLRKDSVAVFRILKKILENRKHDIYLGIRFGGTNNTTGQSPWSSEESVWFDFRYGHSSTKLMDEFILNISSYNPQFHTGKLNIAQTHQDHPRR